MSISPIPPRVLPAQRRYNSCVTRTAMIGGFLFLFPILFLLRSLVLYVWAAVISLALFVLTLGGSGY